MPYQAVVQFRNSGPSDLDITTSQETALPVTWAMAREAGFRLRIASSQHPAWHCPGIAMRSNNNARSTMTMQSNSDLLLPELTLATCTHAWP